MDAVKSENKRIKYVKNLVNFHVGGPPSGYSDYFMWSIEDNCYDENPYVVSDEDPAVIVAIDNEQSTIWRGYEPDSVVMVKLHTRSGYYYEWSQAAGHSDGLLYSVKPYGDLPYAKHSGRNVPILRR